MVMFVMLGLLVTPSDLLPTLVPSVLIAAFLVVIGRPVAVVLCLLPFRFAWNEHAFIAWVGLRGAVAIFLGTIRCWPASSRPRSISRWRSRSCWSR